MTRLKVQIVLVAVVLIGVAGIAAAQTEELVRVIAMGARRAVLARQHQRRNHRDRGGR